MIHQNGVYFLSTNMNFFLIFYTKKTIENISHAAWKFLQVSVITVILRTFKILQKKFAYVQLLNFILLLKRELRSCRLFVDLCPFTKSPSSAVRFEFPLQKRKRDACPTYGTWLFNSSRILELPVSFIFPNICRSAWIWQVGDADFGARRPSILRCIGIGFQFEGV